MRTHIEDDPTDPDMVIVYLDYGGQNQFAYRQERALLLTFNEPTPFADEASTKP